MTTERMRTCSCGKVCKNERGVKIHQARMGCSPKPSSAQRNASPEAHETEEDQGQEEHHSALSLQATTRVEESSNGTTQDGMENTSSAERVLWPKSSDKQKWEKFDRETDILLETTLAGVATRKVKAMSKLIYTLGREEFGTKENKTQMPRPQENRRQKRIADLRRDLRRLTKRHKEARDDEKPGLEELRKEMRERLKSLRRAENHRRKRKERQRKQAQFTKDPFRFVRNVLGEKKSGELMCSKEEADAYIKGVHSDVNRDEDLRENVRLLEVEDPEKMFDDSEPTMKEVRDIIGKARSGSAPGPNGVSYAVYKNCPRLARRLAWLLKAVWRKGKLCNEWLQSEGVFIPKQEDAKHLGEFRTISLHNVEGKVFMAVLARRISTFLLQNGYMDTSVQKGGVAGVSGCVEHTSVISQLITEAKENKGDLAVIWLDIANAYGSVPHKLVQKTLEVYHIPTRIRSLIQSYYDNFKVRFTTRTFTTDWQKLEVGIVTGCTISVVLFSAAMNLIVKSVEKESRGPRSRSGMIQPPTRAFMDDMTITAKSYVEGRWMLDDIVEMITWSRMKLKPVKSRSIVLKKGKVEEKCRYRIEDVMIPSVKEQPIKCLGKWYRGTLNDKENIKEMEKDLARWMEALDKCGLQGKYKAWCYQHGVLPRLLWPLLLYEVPMSKVEAMERKINTFLRRWLSVPRSFSSLGFYSQGSKLQLPLRAVTEEYKAGKVRTVMMIAESQDPKVRQAGIRIRTGRKWQAERAVEEAQSRLRHNDIVGTVTSGRLGLGCVRRDSWKAADAVGRRTLVQQEVRKGEEESRQSKAVEMKKQGSWLHWEGVQQRKVTWNEIWRMDGQRLSFLLKSTYDVLPSPTNLVTWGLTDDPSCKLCGKPANLCHVLSACRVALTDGRYRWRHDRVLGAIGEVLEKEVKKPRRVPVGPQFTTFVRAGQEGPRGKAETGILCTANDWTLLVDTGRQLKFPEEIVVTNKRPDIVVFSRRTKQVVMIELTVPWEERVEESNERKLAKYQPLVDACKAKGWRTWCFAVEVGCRGFVAQSMWRMFGRLGIVGQSRKRTIHTISTETEAASLWIWRRREDKKP